MGSSRLGYMKVWKFCRIVFSWPMVSIPASVSLFAWSLGKQLAGSRCRERSAMRLMSKLGWLGVSGNMWSEDWDLEALFSEELIDSKNFCSFCYISAILFSPRLGIFHIELFSTTWRNLATVLQPARIKGLCSLAERWSSERGISSREVILPALYDFHVILTERGGCGPVFFCFNSIFWPCTPTHGLAVYAAAGG